MGYELKMGYERAMTLKNGLNKDYFIAQNTGYDFKFSINSIIARNYFIFHSPESWL
jgi:hypothetical protein